MPKLSSPTSAADNAPAPGPLAQRACELNLPVVRLTDQGVEPISDQLDQANWLERAVLATPLLARELHRRRNQLDEPAGEPIELWPGVRVLPLPLEPAPANSDQTESDPRLVLMLGPELLSAEQFHAVCGTAQLDHETAVRRARQLPLVDAAQAARLARMLAWISHDTTQLARTERELEGMSDELAESYEELSFLYQFASGITMNQSRHAFLTSACQELCEVLAMRWTMLQLASEDPRFGELRGAAFSAGELACDSETASTLAMSVMTKVHGHHEPWVIDDVTELDIQGLDHITSSMLVVPLRAGGKLLGVMLAGDKHDDSAISTVDTKLCTSIASGLAIFLDNAILYEDVHAMFLGTLHALTSAIDAKDSYTHGHSERVAVLSHQLAIAAGLSESEAERVYLAGLVHDVGKIGVPEAVLCKTGRLTDEEFAQIKKHPEIGARILQDIRQMQDLIPGVLHHHERWDGRGYPHNLNGYEIPLYGRLIGLADAFDAMSSDRTYRQAMQLDQVLAEIQRCRGSQFDPELVDIFLTLDFSRFEKLMEKHRGPTLQSVAK